MRLRPLLCWALLALPAGGAELRLTEPGLYAIDVETGRWQRLGAYQHPSIDLEGRRLYADNGRGVLVRWPLGRTFERPEVFAKPGKDARGRPEPGYKIPLAAPKGGLVAAVREFLVERGGYVRVCLDILDADGARIRGPLPLFGVQDLYSPAGIAAWHPDGQKIAFELSEGTARHGLYVFHPANKYWVLVKDYERGPDEDRPVLQWQPNGRSLSHIAGGFLVLRGGSEYAPYRRLKTDARRHVWLDDETIALLDPQVGLSLRYIEGAERGTIPGWGGGPLGGAADANSSLPAVGRGGYAWVTPAGADLAELRLVFAPRADPGAGRVLATFRRGDDAYSLIEAGPVWHPEDPLLFLVVPSPAN